MLLGQANNKVPYFQCLNILNVSLNPKSDAISIFNTFAPLLSTHSTETFGYQFQKQVLDNTKVQREILVMFKQVGKNKKKPFSQDFQQETNNQQWKRAGSHKRYPPINIFERNNNKDGRKIQQSNRQTNHLVRIKK